MNARLVGKKGDDITFPVSVVFVHRRSVSVKELSDALHLVDGVIQLEKQAGKDAQLMADLFSQGTAHLTGAGADVPDDLLSSSGGEDADEDTGGGEIG